VNVEFTIYHSQFTFSNMSSTFRSKLQQGETLFGSIVSMPCAASAEILADVGYDWLFIDTEHGPLGTNELATIIQSVDHRIPCVVRVTTAEESQIKRALDLGATGIIAPQVNTAEQAAAVVSYCRYAPEGTRGVGIGRAHGYGTKFQSYVGKANQETTVIVQIEHIDAVQAVESIVQVPGIDAILLGPYDLSASLGKMGKVDDPEVIAAIDRVTEVCQKAKLPLGYFGVNAEAVQAYKEKGYTLLVTGTDALFMIQSAKRTLKQIKGGV
jgi:2-keto-3-deoxy-L-rhamnonate aldolase RhmA